MMNNRKLAFVGALCASMLTACTVVATTSVGAATNSALSTCQSTIKSQLFKSGQLTVATDNPVYDPWFQNNKPSSGKGYESATAYAIAADLGFKTSQVKWVTEPFDSSYTPGPKNFDFDINEISVTSARSQAVTFSNSYYNVQQSVVVLKGNRLVAHHTPADLKNALFGDQLGTTGLDYINTQIQPTKTPRTFSSLDEAVAALEAKTIDAIVVDTPTGQYMANYQIVDTKNNPAAVQIGQFATVGEHYGLLFTKGNPLVGCVNTAIADLKAKGKFAALTKQYLGDYTKIPAIKP
jgi:polar amino acid transport system substrate-binding protein